MAGVGLASLPCAKVSPESRKLKSSGTKGMGIGQNGRIASRNRRAEKPTHATARLRFRASGTQARSMREKNEEPRRGQPTSTRTDIPVRMSSRMIGEMPWDGPEGGVISANQLSPDSICGRKNDLALNALITRRLVDSEFHRFRQDSARVQIKVHPHVVHTRSHVLLRHQNIRTLRRIRSCRMFVGGHRLY